MGVCNFRTKAYQEALSNFIDAQKIHQHYQINYNIALCYIKLNNLENAVFYLEAVTKKNKNFFFAYYNLIKIYLKKNNTNDAFLIYRDFSEIIKKEKDKEKLSEQTGITPENRLSVTSFNTLKLFYKIGAECPQDIYEVFDISLRRLYMLIGIIFLGKVDLSKLKDWLIMK